MPEKGPPRKCAAGRAESRDIHARTLLGDRPAIAFDPPIFLLRSFLAFDIHGEVVE